VSTAGTGRVRDLEIGRMGGATRTSPLECKSKLEGT
jgi:hypothetical protein